MVQDEHLALLKQGLADWNEWRRDNIAICADLSGGDLREANLSGADFRDTNLRGINLHSADLRRANFCRANLSRAVLCDADLSDANLSDANLSDAYLSGADLRGAYLSGADLVEAYLSGAKLNGAILHDAKLCGAKIHNADLSNADLCGANLCGATLTGVDFTNADLLSANLRGSELRGVKFIGTKLREADFRRAWLSAIVFVSVDLSRTKGLDTCDHRRPSSVDYRTLGRAKGVPISFWQGCGLPDWQIEAAKLYQSSLRQDDVISIIYEIARIRGEQAIQLFSPFISYSSDDDAFSRKLYDHLQGNGVRCWFAPEDMKIGDPVRHRIDEAIHLHDKLLLVLSDASITSHWVEKEVETAFEKERETGETVLFPIKIDNAIDDINFGWAADIRRSRHIGDFSNWQDDGAFSAAVERVLRDLRADQAAIASSSHERLAR